MTRVTIVDYGMGNLGSIRNMFRRIGAEPVVATDIRSIESADKLLLPGVGAFDAAMTRIDQMGFRKALDRKALVERVPVLGICLGMQLLTRSSEEGRIAGLGWIGGATYRFPADSGLKVPHMGWNIAVPVRPSPLTEDLPEESRFYFVHSYYVAVDHSANSVLQTTYGVTFDSAVQHENVYGAQFHPEKSHKFGMRILQNFASL
ncbi:MAG TPA: imidazole glycerol phosphate synthase subunit HisH [Longimicrobiales bacterium]|nr:imidazole glycerol phosphate synthase subunit HisH [Longimicrobiales bacterium]